MLNKQIVRHATFENIVSNYKHFQEVFSDSILILLNKSLKLKLSTLLMMFDRYSLRIVV